MEVDSKASDVNTALVLVDMQNAFCSKKGSFWTRGGRIADVATVTGNATRLLEAARRARRPVFFTQLVLDRDELAHGLLAQRFPAIEALGAYAPGTWDSEICRELHPLPDEVVVRKGTYDPFVATSFEDHLREGKVRRLVIAGLLTNVCVESTVRSAFVRGFESMVVAEAVATYSERAHESSLAGMERHFAAIVSMTEGLEALEAT